MGSPFFPGSPVAERDGSAAGGSYGEKIHRKRWKSSLGRRISIRVSASATNGGDRENHFDFLRFYALLQKTEESRHDDYN